MNKIHEDIGKVVARMRPFGAGTDKANVPYYMFGHRLEISQRLTNMAGDGILKYQKYPLVALLMDNTETIEGGVINYNLRILIVAMTAEDDRAQARYDKVFIPILYPLYNSFISNIAKVPGFMWPKDFDYPPHKKTDRPRWGISANEGNLANVFNDPLDAIEITDLRVNQNFKPC